ALGGVVPPESHRATVVAEPLSLGVDVLERCALAGGEVRSDSLQLGDGPRVPPPAGGIQSEGPPAAFALRPVRQLADANVRIQPVGMALGELQAQVAAPGVADEEDLRLAQLPADPIGHLFR